MIVVLGCPAAQIVDGDAGAVRPAGLAGWIAVAAAEAGGETQLVGRIGDDGPGDAVVLALARAKVGHAALLRDPARPTPEVVLDDDWREDVASDGPDAAAVATRAGGPSLDPEDVALGLRYLTAFSVLVIADPLGPAATIAALEAGAFAGARTVALLPDARVSIAADDVFMAPAGDPRAFASMIGRYAAALDAGRPPDDALRLATSASGWTPTTDDEAVAGAG